MRLEGGQGRPKQQGSVFIYEKSQEMTMKRKEKRGDSADRSSSSRCEREYVWGGGKELGPGIYAKKNPTLHAAVETEAKEGNSERTCGSMPLYPPFRLRRKHSHSENGGDHERWQRESAARSTT